MNSCVQQNKAFNERLILDLILYIDQIQQLLIECSVLLNKYNIFLDIL